MSGPHNLEAEQALLGAILLDDGMIEHARVDPRHFYDPTHTAFWAEILRRKRAGQLTDPITVAAFARVTFAEIGGADYVRKLAMAGGMLPRQVAAYAEVIVEHAERRAAIAAFDRAKEALSAGANPGDTLRELDALMREMGDAEPPARSARENARALVKGIDCIGLPTGLPSLDANLGGLYPGELIIIGGRPSMGKTALADQIARNVAERGAVHFASMDMSGAGLAARSISARSWLREYNDQRVRYFDMRGGAQNIDRQLLAELAEECPDSLIVDDRAAQTCDALEQSARATRKRCGGLSLIVVDYLQLMRAPGVEGRVQEVSAISAGLKAVAKRLACPLIALSQLSRGVESRDNKRPTMADLRDSGAIEQDADVILGAYREAYYLERNEPDGTDPDAFRKWQAKLESCRSTMEVIRLKQRQGPIGSDVLTLHAAFDVVGDRRAA